MKTFGELGAVCIFYVLNFDSLYFVLLNKTTTLC